MKDHDEPRPDALRSSDPDLLERLFRYAREDGFVSARQPASRREHLAEWERYEKAR